VSRVMSRRSLPAHKNKYMLAMAASLIACAPFVYALDTEPAVMGLHAGITKEALGETLCAGNLKAVMDANESQDAPGSEGEKEKRRHFEGSVFPAALAYVNREKTRALNLSTEADSDGESRADALRHLGLMLHAVQDFYLHTNYVELALEDAHNKSDPYNIPLVDWSRIPDGYVGTKSGAKLAACETGSNDEAINKDSLMAAGGRVGVPGGGTQYSVARDLAVRETQRQWNLFETLVRAKCAGRSSAVLTALRNVNAPPPTADKD
jgi:Heterokaryon incompatibility protein Het-C